TSSETSGDDALQALAQALADLETRVATLETAQASTEQEMEAVQEDVETVKEVVDTEEFARLRDSLPDILKKFNKLDGIATPLPSKNPKGNKNKQFKFL
ncbi:phage capsid protein, partial [Xenorhabdus sp. Vera]|nr:phage capsid protein [Xenorhabdus sp. Vera]